METIKGLYSDVVDATVRALYSRAKDEQSSMLYYQELGLNEYEPDVPEEVLNDMSGFGRAPLSSEGQEYNVVTKVKGYPVTLAMRKYTAKFVMTEEDLHWLAKSASSKRMMEVRNDMSEFEQSMNQRWNEDACRVFYLGHGTTFLKVGNDEALFAAHSLKNGETQYNNFGSGDTQRPLGPTAVTDAISRMNRFKNHNGIQLLPVRDLRLIISTEKAAYAYKLIDSRQGPDVANLGLQVASAEALKRRGINISVVIAPDIPYAYREYWALSEAGRAKRRAFMAYAWKPRMNEAPEYDNGTVKKTGSTVFGPVILGWQWAFGSTGTGNTI